MAKTLHPPQKDPEKPRWNINPTANWGAYMLAYLSLGALALCLLASMPLVPLIDLPEHIAQAVIWANPHLYPDYRLNPFTPYLTGVILTGTLSKSLGPILAYKITLALLILSLPLSLREIFKALNPPSSPRSPKPQRSDWLALVGFPLSFGFAFHMGFLNFCLAVPLSLWILALIGKERARQAITPQKTLGLTALLTLLFFTHPVALALTLLLYPCFAQKWSPSKYLPLLLPVLLLLTWLATQTPKASDAMSFSLQGGRIPTKPLLLNLSDRTTEFLSYIQGGEWKVLPQGSPLALSALGLACLLLYLPRKKPQNPTLALRSPALLALALTTLTYLLIPHPCFNILYVGERLPIFIATFALGLLPSLLGPSPTAPPKKWKVGTLLATLTLNLLHLTPLHPQIQNLQKNSQDLAKILSHIPEKTYVQRLLASNSEGKTKPFFYWSGWIATRKADTRYEFTLASHLPIQRIAEKPIPTPQLILTNRKRTKSLGIPLAQEGPYTLLIPATKNPETKPHAPTLLPLPRQPTP